MADSVMLPVVIRLVPLVASTAGHICTVTQTKAFTAFLKLPTPEVRASTIRAWSKPYLYSLGPEVLGSHFTYAISLYVNFSSRFSFNYELDSAAGWLYTAALMCELLCMSLVFAKGKAVDAVSSGKDDGRTIEGVRQIQAVNGWRLLLVDLPGWLCTFAATVRALQSAS